MNTTVFKEFSGFRLDTESRELWRGSEQLTLSPKELEILCLLVDRPGRLVTKDEIVEAVWSDSFVEESNLSRQIYLLRKRLSGLGAPRDLIENVPKRGYRFNGRVFDGPADTVVERHTFSQTLIEEIHTSEDSSTERPMPVRRRHRRIYLATSVACCFAILAGIAFAAWQLTVPTRPQSVAVLPFRVVGKDRDSHEGVAVADLLITRLSGIRGLTVRPTSAVMNLDPSAASTDAGMKLGVESIIEGTVLDTRDGRRVTVRMLSVPSGKAIWTGEFEVGGGSLFSVHDEIAGRVIDAVFSVEKTGQHVAARDRISANDEAFNYYAEARYHWNKRNAEGIARAEFLFRKAIEADPEFVLAKIGLAETLMMGYEYSVADVLLNEAEASEPQLSEIYSPRGFIEFFHRRDGAKAEANLKRAVELNANNGSAHQWYALLLAVQGRFPEAKAMMSRAIEIDPLSANYLADMGQIHYFAGELDDAEIFARRSLELQPNFAMALLVLADVNLARGDFKPWVENFAMAQGAISDSDPERIAEKAAGRRLRMIDEFKRGGIDEVENAILKESEVDNNPNRFIGRARIFARRGQKDLAIASLNQALESKAFLIPFVKADPAFKTIRQDPAFQDVIDRIGF